MNTVLKKITAAAKRIRKANPKIEWKTAVKKAGAAYRAGSKPVKKKAVKKTATKKGKVMPILAAPGFETVRKAFIETLTTSLGKLELKKIKATTARDKKKIGKEAAEVKKRIRKFLS